MYSLLDALCMDDGASGTHLIETLKINIILTLSHS